MLAEQAILIAAEEEDDDDDEVQQHCLSNGKEFYYRKRKKKKKAYEEDDDEDQEDVDEAEARNGAIDQGCHKIGVPLLLHIFTIVVTTVILNWLRRL